ncbi:unnamed protein product [Rotaria sp. Silwood2]|nr:unnamed protein product [Rotaria sp. Silwood2]
MNLSKKSSCSTDFKDHYIPPYQRLLRRNQSWKLKKLKQELDLQRECRNGKLTLFQQPENYLCYFIHERTDIFILDKLIDQVKLTNHFSMDTEDDALSHKPATLQVEFIRHTLPSIIIIIEVQYLPSITTPLFKKIQQLCTMIFTSNNHIYLWGSALQELGKLNSFNLFNTGIKIQEYNIQDEYSNDKKTALQIIIKHEFTEYLNKTATLAEWACGVGLALGTYLSLDVVGPEQYAMNDVFAVTKLSYKLNLIQFLPTSYYEDISEDEEDFNVQQELSIDIQPLHEELIVHVTDELEETNENELSYQPHEDIEPTRQINDQPYESNDINTTYVAQDVIELQPGDNMDT